MASGRNIWQTIQSEVRGGPMALSIFLAGFIAFIMSIVLSFEDFMSSLDGIRSLEAAFGIQAVSYDFVRYFMALAPQVGQIVFLALWSLDTSRKWALVAGIGWFLLDFISDVQFRSAGMLFPSTGGIELGATVYVSAIMTFLYFTVGAEMFMVAGSAIVLTLYVDAKRQWGVLRKQVRDVGRENRDSKRSDRNEQKSSPRSDRTPPPARVPHPINGANSRPPTAAPMTRHDDEDDEDEIGAMLSNVMTNTNINPPVIRMPGKVVN